MNFNIPLMLFLMLSLSSLYFIGQSDFINFDIFNPYDDLTPYFVLIFIILVLITIINVIKTKPKNKTSINKRSVGAKYEQYVGNYYQNLGYEVDFRGLRLGKLDGGIDLIATQGNDVIFIQCKYWYKKQSINHQMIKEFFGNCNIEMNKQKLNQSERENITCVYVVPSYNTFHYSAIATCKDNYEYLRYTIIKATIKP